MDGTVDLSKYHSIRSAAKMVGISPNAVRNWVLTGRVPHQKDAAGRFYIHEDDITKVQEEREAKRIATEVTTAVT